jgi:hypothetical protein
MVVLAQIWRILNTAMLDLALIHVNSLHGQHGVLTRRPVVLLTVSASASCSTPARAIPESVLLLLKPKKTLLLNLAQWIANSITIHGALATNKDTVVVML